jgi:hypothetical protein
MVQKDKINMERVKSLIKNEFEVLSHKENREDYICTRTDC